MPALPAITFMGLRGVTAWLALGGAGVAGYVVATRVVPSLVGGGTRSAATPASGAPNADAFRLVGDLARVLGESSARVAISTLGPAASIATEGVRLAGDVTEVLGRATERSTTVLGDVARESIRANARQSEALIELVTRDAPAPRGETFLPPTTRNDSPPPAQLGTDAPPPPPAPVVVTVPATSVRLQPSEVTAGIERELALRGITLEQHLAKVNIPALFSAPGVIVTDADRAAVAAGRVPIAVHADGRLAYAEGM